MWKKLECADRTIHTSPKLVLQKKDDYDDIDHDNEDEDNNNENDDDDDDEETDDDDEDGEERQPPVWQSPTAFLIHEAHL